MRSRATVLAAGLFGAVILGATPTAFAEGSVECTAATPVTGVVTANVTVPEGQDCRITDATVNGNVEVKSTGGLIVEGSTINGNVRGSGAEYWGFTDTDGGDPTVINGNVELVETISNPMAGMVSMSRYNFACEATEFNGNVSIRGGSDLADFLFGSPDGGADMMRAPDLNMQVMECSEMMGSEDTREGNFVSGNYEDIDNSGEVRNRDNTFDSHVSLFGNTAAMPPADDIDLVRNAVAQHLTCQGNTPVPYQEGNSETGPGNDGDQCPTP